MPNTRHLRAPAAFLLLAASLAGCKSVGPDYAEPTLATPESWATLLPAGTNTEPASLAQWWTTLNDPVLSGLVERAMQSNLDVKLAAQRIEEARAARGLIQAGDAPTLDANGSYSRSTFSENTNQPTFGGGHQGPGHDLFSTGLSASWELDVFGAVRRGVEAADADIHAAEWSKRDVLVMLAGDVAMNYIQLRTAQQRAEVARSNVHTQQQTLELTQNRQKAGLGSELDVTRAKSQLAGTQALVPLLEAEARQAIYRLSTLLGQHPGSLIAELEPLAAIPGVQNELPLGVPSDLVRRRPDLRIAERNLAAASARIGVATTDLYPHFSLAGDIGLSASKLWNIPEGDSRFWSIGPGVRWNIFDGGRIRSNIAINESRADQALTRYEQTLLIALREVDSSVVGLSKQRENLAALTESVAAQQRAVELANQLYGKGLTDFLTVLDTQRRLLEVQDQLTISQGSAANQLVGVYKALGGGWEH